MPRGSDPKPGPLSVALARILSGEVQAQVITQSTLGALCGMSPSQVGKSLRGERIMDIEQIARMCVALGLDLVDVIVEAVRTR